MSIPFSTLPIEKVVGWTVRPPPAFSSSAWAISCEIYREHDALFAVCSSPRLTLVVQLSNAYTPSSTQVLRP